MGNENLGKMGQRKTLTLIDNQMVGYLLAVFGYCQWALMGGCNGLVRSTRVGCNTLSVLLRSVLSRFFGVGRLVTSDFGRPGGFDTRWGYCYRVSPEIPDLGPWPVAAALRSFDYRGYGFVLVGRNTYHCVSYCGVALDALPDDALVGASGSMLFSIETCLKAAGVHCDTYGLSERVLANPSASLTAAEKLAARALESVGDAALTLVVACVGAELGLSTQGYQEVRTAFTSNANLRAVFSASEYADVYCADRVAVAGTAVGSRACEVLIGAVMRVAGLRGVCVLMRDMGLWSSLTQECEVRCEKIDVATRMESLFCAGEMWRAVVHPVEEVDEVSDFYGDLGRAYGPLVPWRDVFSEFLEDTSFKIVSEKLPERVPVESLRSYCNQLRKLRDELRPGRKLRHRDLVGFSFQESQVVVVTDNFEQMSVRGGGEDCGCDICCGLLSCGQHCC